MRVVVLSSHLRLVRYQWRFPCDDSMCVGWRRQFRYRHLLGHQMVQTNGSVEHLLFWPSGLRIEFRWRCCPIHDHKTVHHWKPQLRSSDEVKLRGSQGGIQGPWGRTQRTRRMGQIAQWSAAISSFSLWSASKVPWYQLARMNHRQQECCDSLRGHHRREVQRHRAPTPCRCVLLYEHYPKW